jgi:hypothetical protein
MIYLRNKRLNSPVTTTGVVASELHKIKQEYNKQEYINFASQQVFLM